MLLQHRWSFIVEWCFIVSLLVYSAFIVIWPVSSLGASKVFKRRIELFYHLKGDRVRESPVRKRTVYKAVAVGSRSCILAVFILGT